MSPPILILRDIELTFGGIPLFERAELTVSPGDRICLVGRNGSGKSTLMKIATGNVAPDDGNRFLHPGSSIRYLAQEPSFKGFETTLEYVLDGLDKSDDIQRANAIISQLELNGKENPECLSGGQLRRCAIARVLAPEPDILFLDEPTNHLDLPTIEWLETQLKNFRSAIVIISHDRRFLENLSRTTIWINDGKTHRLAKGFSQFESWRDTFLQNQEIERHKLDRKISSEIEWLHKGVTARRKRNMGRLRALQKLRNKKLNDRAPKNSINMLANKAESSGKRVCVANKISKTFNSHKVVIDFSTIIGRGERLGIIGPNGIGKTTLLNLLMGTLNPDKGNIRLGKNLKIEKLDQQRHSLDPDSTLAQALTGGGDKITVNGETRHVISYMKDFLFTPNQAKTPVKVLSGGERGRIMLARALAKPSNVLILDEPTNDLDLETLDLLQELLANYEGTILLVSHDRDFLDRIVTSVIASDGNGKWSEYAGGYSDMILQQNRNANVNHGISEKKRLKVDNKKVRDKNSSQKLTFRDQHALETIPTMIDELNESIFKYSEVLADPTLFQSDPNRFAETTKMLQKAENDLFLLEERWFELEVLREEKQNR